MDSRDLAYEPEVAVEQVYQVTCDGGCEWGTIALDARRADSYAAQHRAWHRNIVETLESQSGRCSSCETEGPIKLAVGRFGELPYLYCGNCGADW